MTGRPCRPDADFKRLWRALMPGIPFPACGVSDESDAGAVSGQVAAPSHDEVALRYEPTSVLGSIQARLNRR